MKDILKEFLNKVNSLDKGFAVSTLSDPIEDKDIILAEIWQLLALMEERRNMEKKLKKMASLGFINDEERQICRNVEEELNSIQQQISDILGKTRNE